MNIIKEQNAEVMDVVLEGRLDTMTAPELEEAVKNFPEEIKSVQIHLEKLEYISSAGLRVLLFTHKTYAKKGGLVITGPNEMVKEVFEITGFSDILNIQE